MSVLVVEDHEPSAYIVTRMLTRRLKLKPKVVSSGKLAMAALRAESFYLVISDFEMPEMNGLELFQAMTSEGFACHFVLHTSADLASLPKFEGARFLGIVPKADTQKLMEHVQYALKNMA